MDTIKNLFIDFVDYIIDTVMMLAVVYVPILVIALLFVLATVFPSTT